MINYQNNWILNVYVQLILADSKRGEASETLFMVRTQARIIFASTAVPREIRFVRLLISQMIFIINTSTWYVGSATEWLEAAGLADTQGKTLPFFAVLLIFKYHLSWTVVKFNFFCIYDYCLPRHWRRCKSVVCHMATFILGTYSSGSAVPTYSSMTPYYIETP